MGRFKRYLDAERLQEWRAIVGGARSVVIVGHAGPDGDAMGSALAMMHYLQRLGKRVEVVMPNRWPDFLVWLPGARDVVNASYRRQHAAIALERADVVMCMDFSDVKRTESLAELFSGVKGRKVMIDHHVNPLTEEFDFVISDPEASATCQIVFCLLYQLGHYEQMSLETAECLYCGLMTDTGAFAYNSRNPEVFSIVSALLVKGVDKDRIYRNVFYSYSLDRLRLQGYLLYEKLQYFSEVHASVLTLTREEMARFNFKKGDAEGFVNLPLQIQGTVLSISLREDTEQDLIRVSLRSVGDFECRSMAEQFFNGGGHANAAGGRLAGVTIEQALETTRQALDAFADKLRQARP